MLIKLSAHNHHPGKLKNSNEVWQHNCHHPQWLWAESSSLKFLKYSPRRPVCSLIVKFSLLVHMFHAVHREAVRDLTAFWCGKGCCRFVCLCVCMHACVCACMCVCVHALRVCVCVCVCMHACVRACFACVCVCTHACMRVWTFVSVEGVWERKRVLDKTCQLVTN